MADLLLAAAVDLSGGAWFGDCWDRIVASLTLGKAGDVTQGQVEGAGLALRAAGPVMAGRPGKVRKQRPVRMADGSYTLLTGTLMERDALVARFGLQPTRDDAALYAQVHALRGECCDAEILGDYAVVQWFPDEGRLRMARSALSQMPLHYWRAGDRIIIASLPRTIFAAGGSTELDDVKIQDSLLLASNDGERSWYRDQKRVAVGTSCTLSRNEAVTRRFWSLDDVKPIHFANDHDYVEAVDEQFARAVGATMEGSRNPAILLSGGFDSQAVASYAVGHLPAGARLQSFTSVPLPDWEGVGRAGAFGDESGHVRALAGIYPQIEPHFLNADDIGYGDRLHQFMLLGSWPSHNEMNMHWVHDAMESAGTKGVDLMLTGEMGNATFSYDGATGLPTWFKQLQWGRLLREVARSDDPRGFWRRLVSLAIMPHVPARWRRAIDRHRPKWWPSAFDTWCPMDEALAKESGALERTANWNMIANPYPYASSRDWRRESFATSFIDGPEISLALALQYGMQLRDPTTFLPFVELCAGIPDTQYLRDGDDRWLARRLLKGRVPDMVWQEKRRGVQTADWPVRFARDRERIVAELDAMRNNARLAGIFDIDRMIGNFETWDGTDKALARDNLKIASAIGRGVATARFIRFAEGHNA